MTSFQLPSSLCISSPDDQRMINRRLGTAAGVSTRRTRTRSCCCAFQSGALRAARRMVTHRAKMSELAVNRGTFSIAHASVQEETEVDPLLRRGGDIEASTSDAAPSVTESLPIDWGITGLCFLFPAVGGLLFGYDIGATSGALVSLTSPELSGTDWYSLTPFQSGAVVSASLLGALAGSVGAFLVGDKLGRKKELLLAAGLYGSAAALMLTAPSLNVLLAGRGLYGVGIGFAMHAAPAYIAETSPPQVRGLLISMKEAFVVAGILLGYAASYAFVEQTAGWRLMFGLAAIPAVILGAGMAWAPNSPRWLSLSGADAGTLRAAVCRVRGRYAADAAAVDTICADMHATTKAANQQQAGFADLFRGRNRQPLLIGTSLMLFQQITGQPSVLYYAAEIFKEAGFANAQDAAGVSVILGVFKLVMTGLAIGTVDRWGRRPLLLWGVGGLTVSLLVLSAAQLALTGQAATWTAVAALLLYVGCYQVSFGPISWLMVGEVFPLAVRGPASALATLTNFGSNFAVSLALPTVQEDFGLGATYLGFAVIGGVALATIYAIVPETKGKTLEEIEAMFGEGHDDKGQ